MLNQIIARFKEAHGDIYDYSDVIYINRRIPVKITCRIHGQFSSAPYIHWSGSGCRECNRKRVSLASFVNRATKTHNRVYDYNKVFFNTLNDIVEIVCPEHGQFSQRADSHLSGRGCPSCGFLKISKNNANDLKTVLDQCYKSHGNKYDYSQVSYVNARNKITIICHKHGVFKQLPANHIKGAGCPRCTKRVSKGCTEWLISLNKPDIIFEYRIPETKFLIADGYVPSTNTVCFYNGDFWHGNPTKYNPDILNPITKSTYGELYNKTLTIEQRIKNLGYSLLTIWESDWLEKKATSHAL
jgi:protein-arginine kinase activator protein McsA